MKSAAPESPLLSQKILRFSGLVPALLSICLFALSLLGAWFTSRQTEYLPIYDVLSYTDKAENVWAELRQGRVLGLLGVEQTIRPFGTSLLGYPFGYSDDFRAFYWRTVAFPACFAAIGALLAAVAAGASWKSPSAWLLACLSGMMPMWWCFDPVGQFGVVSYWGMMDGMQAGVAAVATGLLLLGWQRNSMAVTFAGFFLAAFTLLLKPVGVFLMAGQTIAAACLWVWSWKKADPNHWRRFAAGAVAGVAWCAVVGAACYFSPYFAESNREMGRQALYQLKALKEAESFAVILWKLVKDLSVFGFGSASLLIAGAALIQIPRLAREKPWMVVVCVAAILVLLLELAALYQGTRFLTPRYFLPTLAIAWIFFSPLFWMLLDQSRLARNLVLLNALVLSASVWFPELAREWHSKTGYATFNSGLAVATSKLAKSAVEKSAAISAEPVIYILPGADHFGQALIMQQLFDAGGWKDTIPWPYGPRVWVKHEPRAHPHELASADFLITGSGDFFGAANKPVREIQTFLASPHIGSLAPVVAENQKFAIRRIADPIAFEKAMAARLVAKGLLHPDERGPQFVETPSPAPLGVWDSGDELVSARAEWVGDKLRVTTNWSGARWQKRHLAFTIALTDRSGTPIQWINGGLLPPPGTKDGKQYERTLVDDLDCGGFRERTTGASVGIYDRSGRTHLTATSQAFPKGTAWIPVPLAP